MSGILFLNVNNIQYMIPEDQNKYNYTMVKYGATFYSHRTGTKHYYKIYNISVDISKALQHIFE